MDDDDVESRAGSDELLSAPAHSPGYLSKVASRGITEGRDKGNRKRPWRIDHVVDPKMRAVFVDAAAVVAEANYLHDRGCYRLNVMLTLNADDLAREGEEPQDVLRRIMHSLRNLYRTCPQSFAGCWRCEFGTRRYGGHHYHVAFHVPRGMRDRIIAALQRWLGEPLDAKRSSRSFKRAGWQVRGIQSGWHLRRIHALDGLLDYIAKVPMDRAGAGVSRAVRVKDDIKPVREFATFGLSGLEPTP